MKQTAVEWLESNLPDMSKIIGIGLALELTAKIQKAKEMEIELLKDAYGDGINAHMVNFCNRDEYFQKAFREVGYCPSCGKSSCGGDCS